MRYKTILVHLDKGRHHATRLRLAAALSQDNEAHLVGVAVTGISRLVATDHGGDAVMVAFAEQVGRMRKQAEAAGAAFSDECAKLGLASYEARVCSDDAAGALALQSRYADLVIVSQPDPQEGAFSATIDLPESVAIDGIRPVLVLPYTYQLTTLGQRPVLAWDGSAEAARAITAALPLLQRAKLVTLFVANPEAGFSGHGPQPGADMALYLARHGVPVEVMVRDHLEDVGRELLAVCAERQSDLLVMGCYGHSRFRELLLGGVSRTVLSAMQVPVLMAH